MEARLRSAPLGDIDAALVPMLSPQRWGRANQVLQSRRTAAAAQRVSGAVLLESRGMTDALDTAKRLARVAGLPILVHGERGSCLLELARLIHESDPSSQNAPFRVVAGRFVGQPTCGSRYRTGTLFIEDVDTLTPKGQDWLTELLTDPADSDRSFRVIAGSHLTANALLQHSSLNQELVLMLDVGRVVVPPLRARPDDITELALRFLERYRQADGRPNLRFSSEAERALRAHSYPGNIRELRNVVERAVALESTDEIRAEAIVFHEELAGSASARGTAPDATRRRLASERDQNSRRLPTLSEIEREYLVMLIRELRGRRTEMSRVMGVSYPTVLKKIATHGLAIREILESSGV
jgi:DNA-binding NtrC family response regulator